MERAMCAILSDRRLLFASEYRLPNTQRLDFMLFHEGSARIALEMDGIQHVTFGASEKSADEMFEDVRERDARKDLLLEAMNIHLIRISYTVPVESYEQIVSRALELLTFPKATRECFGQEYDREK
jgi:hypothetical protein